MRFTIYLLLLCLASDSVAEDPDLGQALYIGDDLLKNYQPRSSLTLKQNLVPRAKYPVVDVHTHFPATVEPDFLIDRMNELNVKRVVNLSGGWGNELDELLNRYYKLDPEKFIIFCNIDFSRIDEPEFGNAMARFLELAHARGVKGLKIFKNLGLTVKNKKGEIVPIDDPKMDPIWRKAGELKMPVLIHVADPVAFFKPIDRFNERWLQLHRHPDWSFFGPQFPAREEILEQRNKVMKKHPKTNFVGAHVGNSSEDLGYAGRALDEHPNFSIDMSARVAELGRQPYSARKFFIKYQDRIMFGTDRYPGRPTQPRYKIYYRFLETDDEYFDYYDNDFPPTGEWKIYGIFLPDEVLKKVYYQNAERLLGLGE